MHTVLLSSQLNNFNALTISVLELPSLYRFVHYFCFDVLAVPESHFELCFV